MHLSIYPGIESMHVTHRLTYNTHPLHSSLTHFVHCFEWYHTTDTCSKIRNSDTSHLTVITTCQYSWWEKLDATVDSNIDRRYSLPPLEQEYSIDCTNAPRFTQHLQHLQHTENTMKPQDILYPHSTVTLFARFLGKSTLSPSSTANQ